MKFNVKVFGLTCGLIWGLGLMIITWWIILWDGSMAASTFIGRIYRGYNFTFLGSIFGLIWGFFDGLIGGIIFAWLYNKLAGKKE